MWLVPLSEGSYPRKGYEPDQTEGRVSYFICTEQKSPFPAPVWVWLGESRLAGLHHQDRVTAGSGERLTEVGGPLALLKDSSYSRVPACKNGGKVIDTELFTLDCAIPPKGIASHTDPKCCRFIWNKIIKTWLYGRNLHNIIKQLSFN